MGSDLKALAREAGMLAVSRIVAATGGGNGDGSGSAGAEAEAGAGDPTNGSRSGGTDVSDANADAPDAAAAAAAAAAASNAVALAGAAVTMADFLLAAKTVQPTAKREGFAVVPNVTWSDVGALAEVHTRPLHIPSQSAARPDHTTEGCEPPRVVNGRGAPKRRICLSFPTAPVTPFTHVRPSDIPTHRR